MRRIRIKVACAALLMLFNLATAFTGVYAWFTAVRRTDAAGMRVQMYAHELDLSYRVYKYSDEDKRAIDATDRQDAFALSEYDSVFADRNGRTPIIVDFSLRGAALSEGSPIRVSATCSNPSPSAKVLSNIVELKFGLPAMQGSDALSIWSGAVLYFGAEPGERFKRSGEKDLEVSYVIDGYGAAMSNNTLHFFMQLNYASDLIGEFDFDLSDSQTTAFSNDLTAISCNVEGD